MTMAWHRMVIVKAQFTPDGGAQFIDVIECAAKHLTAGEGNGGDEATAQSDLPFDVLRADALPHAIV